MKKIKYHLIAGSLVMLALTGCGKEFLDSSLDREQTPETVITNRGTIWQFANAMYAPIEYGFSSIDGNLFAAASDEAQQTVTYGNVYSFTNGIISPTNNPLSGRYTSNYEGIRAALFFLDYVKDGKGMNLLALNRDIIRDAVNYERDKKYLNYAIAEASIVKAYFYGELIKMYGGVPIVETTFQQAPDKLYPRENYETVVSYIVNLIDTNKDQLAVNWDSDKGRNGRFTLGAALAIKSRVLLYAASPLNNPGNDNNKWLAAAQAAHDLMTHTSLSYSLHSSYGPYFVGNAMLTSSETIYAVRNSESDNPERLNYPIGIRGGNSGVCPTHNLVECYESLVNATPDPDNAYYGKDPRLAATVVYNGSMWNQKQIAQAPGEDFDMTVFKATRTGYYLKKFLTDNLNFAQSGTAQHNWPVYRYAEILLNYAEAMNEVYGPSSQGTFTLSAAAALKMVRDRASTDLPQITTTDKDEFREIIKRERMIELSFEGHRYWDLLRWKDAEIVLNRPVTGVKVTKVSGKYVYTVQSVAPRKFDTNRHYLLPFMRDEIVNSKGTLTQNPGYDD